GWCSAETRSWASTHRRTRTTHVPSSPICPPRTPRLCCTGWHTDSMCWWGASRRCPVRAGAHEAGGVQLNGEERFVIIVIAAVVIGPSPIPGYAEGAGSLA